MVLIIINLFIIIFFEHKYRIFKNERIIDLLLDPSYWIWICLYKYNYEEKKSFNSLIFKLLFAAIYYLYLVNILLKLLFYDNRYIFLILTVVIAHVINYVKIKKGLKHSHLTLTKNFIDFFVPYYCISIAYYNFDQKYKKYDNKINIWFTFSRYFFSFNSLYILYLLMILILKCI